MILARVEVECDADALRGYLTAAFGDLHWVIEVRANFSAVEMDIREAEQLHRILKTANNGRAIRMNIKAAR